MGEQIVVGVFGLLGVVVGSVTSIGVAWFAHVRDRKEVTRKHKANFAGASLLYLVMIQSLVKTEQNANPSDAVVDTAEISKRFQRLVDATSELTASTNKNLAGLASEFVNELLMFAAGNANLPNRKNFPRPSPDRLDDLRNKIQRSRS